MRRGVRWLLGAVSVVLLVLGGAWLWFVAKYPAVPAARELGVAATPDRVDRGRYLVTHVTVCVDCHSQRDWSRFSGPVLVDTLGSGGRTFGPEAGFPGRLTPPNITPAALGTWSDGEIARAITEGVNREGRALFPFMPYPLYASLDPQDLAAIIAYLRTLKPIERATPPTALDFPLNLLVRTMPKPAQLVPAPSRQDEVAYGRYLTTIAGCVECHTPKTAKGQRIENRLFAGGEKFAMGNGQTVVSKNLTPHPTDGLGDIAREDFLGMFRGYTDGAPPMPPQAPNTPMPWTQYAGMTDEDLGAIHAYLQSLPPLPAQ